MATIEGRFLSDDEERILKEAAATKPGWRFKINRSGTARFWDVTATEPGGLSRTQTFEGDGPPEAVALWMRELRLEPYPKT